MKSISWKRLEEEKLEKRTSKTENINGQQREECKGRKLARKNKRKKKKKDKNTRGEKYQLETTGRGKFGTIKENKDEKKGREERKEREKSRKIEDNNAIKKTYILQQAESRKEGRKENLRRK